MSDQMIDQAKSNAAFQDSASSNSSRKGEGSARTVSVCIFFIVLIATALLLQQIGWTILISVELMLVLAVAHALGSNLPTRLRRQVKLNSHRSDGSRSKRRSAIERDSVRRFKFDILVCFAFTLIPANVLVLTHLFFFPQLIRLRESIVLGPKQQWAAIFLEPAFQLLLLILILAAFLFNSLKGIYFRRLKDLDEEICYRAEDYAIYDLVHPPETSKRMLNQESTAATSR